MFFAKTLGKPSVTSSPLALHLVNCHRNPGTHRNLTVRSPLQISVVKTCYKRWLDDFEVR